MNTESSFFRSTIIFLAVAGIFALGGFWRIELATLPVPELSRQGYLDDGFYYLKIADNIAKGNGSTFDGISSTNGYHPLWLGILVFLHNWYPDFHTDFLRASVILAALLNLGSALFVGLTVWLLTSSSLVRLGALALYVLNPHLVHASINGMETSLYLFLLSILFYLFFKIVVRGTGSLALYGTLGIVSALAFLCRIDSLILLLALFAGIYVFEKEKNLPKALALLAAPFLTVGAYVAINYFYFDSFFPVSAAATALEIHYLLGVPVGLPGNFSEAFWLLKHGTFFLVQDLIERSAEFPIRETLLVFIGIALGLLALPKSGEMNSQTLFRKYLYALMFPVLGLGIIFFINSFIRYFNQIYYPFPWTLLVAYFIAIVGVGLSAFPQFLRRTIIGTFIALSLFAYFVEYRLVYLTVPLERGKQIGDVSKWLSERVTKDTRVGSVRRGGEMMFWGDFHAVNLDGKVNNIAFEYKKERRMDDYLRDYNIEYIIEHMGQMESNWPVFATNSSAHPKFELLYSRGKIGAFKVVW